MVNEESIIEEHKHVGLKDINETTAKGQEVTDGTVQETDSTYSKLSVFVTILFSGLAIGSDGYNVSTIGNLSLVFARLYPKTFAAMHSRLSNSFIIGMIVGMLGFGYTTDKIGRKSGAVLTTLILVVGLAMSAGSSGKNTTGLFWMMIISRGIAGVGAGGEYPVSGAGAAEATDENAGARKNRGFIFAMISSISATLGFVFGGLVPLLLILCIKRDEGRYDLVWRVTFAMGIVPPLSIFWFRYRMAVSSAYRKSAAKKQTFLLIPIFKRYWRRLLGASLAWFLYNYISYPFGLFASTIIESLGVGDDIIRNMGWAVVINCFYIPGPFVGGYLSDRIGRRKTLCLGYTLQAILGFILGGAIRDIQKILPLFIVLYGIFLTLGEVGPGATVFAISSESFPTSIRGQCLGIIVAFGKAGGAIGTAVFSPILTSFGDNTYKGTQAVFLIGSGFAAIGALAAFFIIPEINPNLDDEDEAWKTYLKDNGYEIEWGDANSKDPKGITKDEIRT